MGDEWLCSVRISERGVVPQRQVKPHPVGGQLHWFYKVSREFQKCYGAAYRILPIILCAFPFLLLEEPVCFIVNPDTRTNGDNFNLFFRDAIDYPQFADPHTA